MLRNKNILVVEDDQAIQHILTKHLKILRFNEYFSTTSVDHALILLKEERINLIILDLMLEGGKNGRELLNYLIENDISMPVIIYSAVANKEKQELIYEYSTNKKLTIYIIQKPVSNNIDFLEKIIQILDQHDCLLLRNDVVPSLENKLDEQSKKLKEFEENLSLTVKDIVKDIFKNLPSSLKKLYKEHKALVITSIASFIATATATAFNYYEELLKK